MDYVTIGEYNNLVNWLICFAAISIYLSTILAWLLTGWVITYIRFLTSRYSGGGNIESRHVLRMLFEVLLGPVTLLFWAKERWRFYKNASNYDQDLKSSK